MDSITPPEVDDWLQWITRSDVDFVYIPITRCASNWVHDQLMCNGFYQIPHEEKHLYADKKRLVIIREPVERVISGMFISFCEMDELESQPNQRSFEEVLKKDIHTSGQITYLPAGEPYTTDKYVFIKFDQDLPNKLNKYMASFGITLKQGSLIWLSLDNNPGIKNSLRRQIGMSSKENREKVYRDPKLLNMFRTYLKEDYKLYDSITWFE